MPICSCQSIKPACTSHPDPCTIRLHWYSCSKERHWSPYAQDKKDERTGTVVGVSLAAAAILCENLAVTVSFPSISRAVWVAYRTVPRERGIAAPERYMYEGRSCACFPYFPTPILLLLLLMRCAGWRRSRRSRLHRRQGRRRYRTAERNSRRSHW